MRKFIVMAAMAACTMAIFQNVALACGESMFRVGKGVHYRAYSAPIPGSILVYARTDSERSIAENLRLAGHKVLIVANDEDLAREMQDQEFDIVVAPYSKREAVEAQSAEIAAHPDWLPVVEDGSADQRIARTQYDHVVTTREDVRSYLKAIHKTLKAKGA